MPSTREGNPRTRRETRESGAHEGNPRPRAEITDLVPVELAPAFSGPSSYNETSGGSSLRLHLRFVVPPQYRKQTCFHSSHRRARTAKGGEQLWDTHTTGDCSQQP